MGRIPPMDEIDAGIVPVEFNVLIAPEEVETKTAGGIILTQTTAETEQLAAMRGRLVAVAPRAGASIWPEDGPLRPKIGDAIYFAKYAGILVKAADGRELRMCKDKDVMGIIEERSNG
jgi:co-chaperonin GroES (HSP10)